VNAGSGTQREERRWGFHPRRGQLTKRAESSGECAKNPSTALRRLREMLYRNFEASSGNVLQVRGEKRLEDRTSAGFLQAEGDQFARTKRNPKEDCRMQLKTFKRRGKIKTNAQGLFPTGWASNTERWNILQNGQSSRGTPEKRVTVSIATRYS